MRKYTLEILIGISILVIITTIVWGSSLKKEALPPEPTSYFRYMYTDRAMRGYEKPSRSVLRYHIGLSRKHFPSPGGVGFHCMSRKSWEWVNPPSYPEYIATSSTNGYWSMVLRPEMVDYFHYRMDPDDLTGDAEEFVAIFLTEESLDLYDRCRYTIYSGDVRTPGKSKVEESITFEIPENK